jgi:PEGA domain
MKKLLCVVALTASASGLGGCATVMNGTSQPVEFSSDPGGAQVKLVSGLTCETPCQYSLKRGKDNVVTFTKDGYKSETVYIQSRTGGMTVGNVLAGGIIGGVVDGSNGASNHLYPDPVSIRLVPVGSNEPAVLLNKKGEVISTVAEYNAKVADDVNKGLAEQGIRPMGSAIGGQE